MLLAHFAPVFSPILGLAPLSALSPPCSVPLQEPVTVETTTLPDGRRVEFETTQGPDGQTVRHGAFRVFGSDAEEGSDQWLVSGSYAGGVRDGAWRYRYASGDLAASGKFRAGEPKGRWRFLWPDGSVAASGPFKEGLPAGKWDLSNPLDPKGKSRSVVLTPVAGESPVDGATYRGFLADDRPIGWWRILRADGSLMFDGAFDELGELRAATFRHAGSLPDPVFFAELRDTPHPHDFAFRPLGEYGLGESEPVPTALDVAGSLESLQELWKTDETFGSVKPTKLKPAPEKARIIAYPPGYLVRELRSETPAEVQLGLASSVKALASIDWTDLGASRSALSVVQEQVVPSLGYPDLGFEFRGKTPAAKRNGLAVLRAHSVLTIKRHDLDFWSIDAAVETTAPGEGLPLQQVSWVDPRAWLSKKDQKVLKKFQPKKSKRRKPSSSRKAGSTASSGEVGRAINAGLDWLVTAQRPDGRWCGATEALDGSPATGLGRESKGHDVGVTALALLALIRDEATPGDDVRMEAVRNGLRFILGARLPNLGVLANAFPVTDAEGNERVSYSFAWIYSHSAAIQALAEAQELIHSPRLELGLADAIEVVMKAKNPYGVWRYTIPPNGDNDMSVLFWVMRGLLAAERVGHPIDGNVIKVVQQFMAEMTDEGTGRVGYSERGSPSSRSPGTNQERFPHDTGETLTAEAVALRRWLGQPIEGLVQDGAELMLRRLPKWDPSGVALDYGYWLAGTEAFLQVGGKYEKVWREAVTPALLDGQLVGDGSWDPIGPWGHAGGRTYTTASAVLTLQLLKE